MFNRLFFKQMTHMLIVAFSIFIATQAVIHEVKNFDAIMAYFPDGIPTESLVILDLDNVTIHPKNQNHGSDEWFCAQLTYRTKTLNEDFNQAVEAVLPSYFEQLEQATMVLVEPFIKFFIADLVKKNIPVLALTARSHSLHELTIKQLQSVDISLTNNHDIIQETGDAGDPIYYRDGIIFCGKNNKGKVLELCIERLGLNPKTIIFVDDKQKNLEAVEGIGHDGREFIGFRYGFLDQHVKNFITTFKP